MVSPCLHFFTCLKVLLRKCCQKLVVKIAVISAISLFLYTYYINYLHKDRTVSLHRKFGLAYTLITNNGSFMSDNTTGLSNLNEEQKDDLTRELQRSLNKFAAHCHEESARCLGMKYKKSRSLLTLFTTFVYDEEKLFVNNNTLFNWKNLPNVNLVIFSNCSTVQYYAKLANWHVLPVLVEAANAPVLPNMFQSVMREFDSDFYGYANADLLFTDDLVTTLETILCEMDFTRSLLVVGKRTNIPASYITQEGALSWEFLKISAENYGTLFQPDAEDYFITEKNFPWGGFLPLAVGRRGYDNWIVTFSRQNNIPVIDVSGSVLCLHQTLESRGNFEGLNKGDNNLYNLDILYKLNLPYSWPYWGRTICAGLRTFVNLCGNIEIEPRIQLDSSCTRLYLTHRIWKALGF